MAGGDPAYLPYTSFGPQPSAQAVGAIFGVEGLGGSSTGALLIWSPYMSPRNSHYFLLAKKSFGNASAFCSLSVMLGTALATLSV